MTPTFISLSARDTHYHFVALPFRVVSALGVFIKVLALVLALLCLQGILVVGYLDDLLLRADSVSGLQSSLDITVKTLEILGWLINFSKSTLCQSHRLEYLGLILDSRFFLPPDMLQKLVTCFPVFVWEYGHYPDVRESPGPAASVLRGGSLCSTPHQDLSTGDTSEVGRVSNFFGLDHFTVVALILLSAVRKVPFAHLVAYPYD